MAELIEGLEPLRMSFAEISTDMQRNVSRQMVVAAGGVIRTEAKNIAQSLGLRKTGALIKNIAIKREKTPDGITQYNVGVRHGKDLGKKAKKLLVVGKSGRIVTKYLNDPFYWRFLEFTTKNRQGTPFIGKALDNKRTESIYAMAMRLRTALEKQGLR